MGHHDGSIGQLYICEKAFVALEKGSFDQWGIEDHSTSSQILWVAASKEGGLGGLDSRSGIIHGGSWWKCTKKYVDIGSEYGPS